MNETPQPMTAAERQGWLADLGSTLLVTFVLLALTFLPGFFGRSCVAFQAIDRLLLAAVRTYQALSRIHPLAPFIPIAAAVAVEVAGRKWYPWLGRLFMGVLLYLVVMALVVAVVGGLWFVSGDLAAEPVYRVCRPSWSW